MVAAITYVSYPVPAVGAAAPTHPSKTIPAIPATAPTNKSIPEIKIAKNSPNASKILTELCFKICGILSLLKILLGFTTIKTNNNSKKIPIVP